MKIQNIFFIFFFGGVRLRGGQGGCELRSEALVKIQKKKFFFWEGGGGIRVDGNGEVKLL